MNRSALLLIGLGAALLAGLFLALRPAALPSASTTAVAPAVRLEFAIAQGALAAAPASLQLRQGSAVTLVIRSDREDELHLHGYDLALPLRANEPATLSFQADRSGRFELELHGTHLELGALQVLPP